MTDQDYYAVLEIEQKATEADIKAAFRRLARKYHPDVNPGDKDAEKRFKEINEAHEVLSDPEKRKLYDAMRLKVTEPEDEIDPLNQAIFDFFGELGKSTPVRQAANKVISAFVGKVFGG